MKGLHGTAHPHGPDSRSWETGSRAKAAVRAYGGPTGGGNFQRPGPTSYVEGQSCPSGGRCLWRACGEQVLPTARAHPGGMGTLAQVLVGAYGRLAGSSSLQRPGPTSLGDGPSCPSIGPCLCRACGGGLLITARADEMGGPGLAQSADGTHGGLAGDSSSQRPEPSSLGDGECCLGGDRCLWRACGDGCSRRRGPTSGGDRESCTGGGRCLWRHCEGRWCATAWAPQRGGRKVLPRWSSVPKEGLKWLAVPNGPDPRAGGTGISPKRRLVPMESWWGMAIPNGPGPPAGGSGSTAQVAVGAYGGPMGNGNSQQPGPTGWGGGKSCPGGGWCLWCQCGGRRFPTARAHQLGGRKCCPGVGHCLWRACGVRHFPTARDHRLGGRGVVATRRSVPMEGLRGGAISNKPGPTAGGTGSCAGGKWYPLRGCGVR